MRAAPGLLSVPLAVSTFTSKYTMLRIALSTAVWLFRTTSFGLDSTWTLPNSSSSRTVTPSDALS